MTTDPDHISDESAGSDKPEAEVDFEASLAELEALVGKMETGELSLEDSLEAFERGVALTRRCQAALEKAELRIKALMPDGSERPIDALDESP